LLKNGDAPKSPFAPHSSAGAIGEHNFDLKIDLGFEGTVGTGV
jgi:hypothetical protein